MKNLWLAFCIFGAMILTPVAQAVQGSVNLRKVSSASIPWSGHFAAKNYTIKTRDQVELQQIKKNLRTSILKLPRSHSSALKSLEIRNESHISRGLANHEKIILHTASIETEEELQAVFIHELGHVVDLGKIVGKSGFKTAFWDGNRPIYADDLSVQFYQISWEDATTRKPGASRNDFISGYAMTNCFEDFAEAYVFYRLHGEKFRKIAKESAALQKKYNFMRDYVFAGQEFQTHKIDSHFIHGVIWDATLVKY